MTEPTLADLLGLISTGIEQHDCSGGCALLQDDVEYTISRILEELKIRCVDLDLKVKAE